ncbi:hypothetical protein Meth11DRAFT_0180 [Methylophilaceae bacterium 11]|nr:hypothetical protein Meth11DRAFT_0180 [Methylophilaceae bacterium 11]
MVKVSSIGYAVRTTSLSTLFPIKLGHAHQLVAAALGYKSLAALQFSEPDDALTDDAKHFILDLDLLSQRAQQLNLNNSLSDLESLIKSGISQFVINSKFYKSMDDFLYPHVSDIVDDTVLNDERTTSQMGLTNGDGVDEIYIPIDYLELDELPPVGQQLDLELEGHISMGIDSERPYSGHKIFVRALLRLKRTGKFNFADPECEITDVYLDLDWGDDEIVHSKISLSEALSDELGIELSEARTLVDADYITNESEDGLIHNYVFDFTHHASPEIANKLRAKYRSLNVTVPPWFFENMMRG